MPIATLGAGMVRRLLPAAVAVLVLGAGFAAGRWTAAPAPSPPPAPASSAGDYAAGLRAGEALGMSEGRALQEGAALPPDTRDAVRQAFQAGYAAGANDVFAGYDGGWQRGALYVIAVGEGGARAAYRIASRAELHPGTVYTACGPGPQICERPAR